MSHMPETAYDGHHATWAHRKGDPIPSSGHHTGAPTPASPATTIPPAGSHETLFAVPRHRVARGVSSLVRLDEHEAAVAAVLDAVDDMVAYLDAIYPPPNGVEQRLIDAHRRLKAVQG